MKFLKVSFWSLLSPIAIFNVGDGGMRTITEHPGLFIAYGIVQWLFLIMEYIAASMDFKKWIALLITSGGYIAYLLVGTIIELMVKGIKRLCKKPSADNPEEGQ